ncbi:MAG: hypothetical protein ACKVP0_22630 [Pirellulaceae bacterium]
MFFHVFLDLVRCKMTESSKFPERSKDEFPNAPRLPDEVNALRSKPNQAYAIHAILRTTLNPEGGDKFTQAIGDAFIDRGEAFQTSGQDMEAMRDFATALQFSSTVPWDELRYPRAVNGLNASRKRLGEFLIGKPCKPPVRLNPGYLVVAEGAIIQTFPYEARGKSEAIATADGVAADSLLKLRFFNDYLVTNYDFQLQVYEYNGVASPRSVHTTHSVSTGGDIGQAVPPNIVHDPEALVQMSVWRKLRWEKKSSTFYMVNLDGRYHLAVFNELGNWKWRMARVRSTNYIFSPGIYGSKTEAQNAAFEALYELQQVEKATD